MAIVKAKVKADVKAKVKVLDYAARVFLVECAVVCVCLLCRQLFFADFLPAPLIFKLVPVICLATALLYGCFFNYMLGLTKSSAVTGYLAGRIIRIILFVVLFLIYAFSTKEQLYGFAVELMLAFLAYNLFDTVYFVRFEDKSSK